MMDARCCANAELRYALPTVDRSSSPMHKSAGYKWDSASGW